MSSPAKVPVKVSSSSSTSTRLPQVKSSAQAKSAPSSNNSERKPKIQQAKYTYRACSSCSELFPMMKDDQLFCRKCYGIYRGLMSQAPSCNSFDNRICSNQVHYLRCENILDINKRCINWKLMEDQDCDYYHDNIERIYLQLCNTCYTLQKSQAKQAKVERKVMIKSLPRIPCGYSEEPGVMCQNKTRYDHVKDQGFPYCKECNKRYYQFNKLPWVNCCSTSCELKTNYDAKSNRGEKYCVNCKCGALKRAKETEQAKKLAAVETKVSQQADQQADQQQVDADVDVDANVNVNVGVDLINGDSDYDDDDDIVDYDHPSLSYDDFSSDDYYDMYPHRDPRNGPIL